MGQFLLAFSEYLNLEMRNEITKITSYRLFYYLFYNILSVCHNSDEINYLLNEFRLKKYIYIFLSWKVSSTCKTKSHQNARN